MLHQSIPEQQLLDLRRFTGGSFTHDRPRSAVKPASKLLQVQPEWPAWSCKHKDSRARRCTALNAFWHRGAHAAVASVPPAAANGPAALLLSVGVFLLGAALLALVAAGIPALLVLLGTC